MGTVDEAVDMSTLVIAAAGSARVAQALMSSGTDPMAIKEFKFTVNYATDFKVESTTELQLNIWRISLNEKLTIGYEKHFGIEIECTLVPVVAIE